MELASCFNDMHKENKLLRKYARQQTDYAEHAVMLAANKLQIVDFPFAFQRAVRRRRPHRSLPLCTLGVCVRVRALLPQGRESGSVVLAPPPLTHMIDSTGPAPGYSRGSLDFSGGGAGTSTGA